MDVSSRNKRVAKCKQCGDWYCMECSNHYSWQEFCSHDCMEENDREMETCLEQQRVMDTDPDYAP